jgi:Phosphoribosylamine-glycine ligase
MEKVGILVISYGSRGAAIVDKLSESNEYETELYVVDRQKNPLNIEKAKEHTVIPDLDIEKICKFVERRKEKIDFGIVGPEKPIINGIRDLIEKRTGISLICPTKEYALEGSKVSQRILFRETVKEVNPEFKIFNPKDYQSKKEVKKAVWEWLDELDNKVAVKPDKPAAGKGVGVWEDHFNTREQLFEHFLSNYKYGSVIIEEKDI